MKRGTLETSLLPYYRKTQMSAKSSLHTTSQ